jgi:hypothetical protein
MVKAMQAEGLEWGEGYRRCYGRAFCARVAWMRMPSKLPKSLLISPNERRRGFFGVAGVAVRACWVLLSPDQRGRPAE